MVRVPVLAAMQRAAESFSKESELFFVPWMKAYCDLRLGADNRVSALFSSQPMANFLAHLSSISYRLSPMNGNYAAAKEQIETQKAIIAEAGEKMKPVAQKKEAEADTKVAEEKKKKAEADRKEAVVTIERAAKEIVRLLIIVSNTLRPGDQPSADMIAEVNTELNKVDAAGNVPVEAVTPELAKGGIDFAQSNLEMQIKRDGNGVPLPVSQQDLDSIRIDGLVPLILNIRPATSVPLT